MPKRTDLHRILIIGSGAGGGTAASALAPLCKEGARIAVLEWGPHFNDDEFTGRELEMAEKRSDYFQAGTLVVWDVDPRAEVIHVYRATSPTVPTTYGRGQMAEAEPAVPGWRVAVDWLFS